MVGAESQAQYEGPPITIQMPGQQQQYATQTPLIQLSEWLISNPSIPLSLRRQFHALWENVIFGNFDKMDIERLILKFREWIILMKWYIPDQQWGAEHVFSEQGQENITMDLNLVFSTLEQMYYIQLTRGKDGFTVKELTSTRSINKTENIEEKKKASWW